MSDACPLSFPFSVFPFRPGHLGLFGAPLQPPAPENAVFSEIHDLGNLMNEIQKDSRLGFSTVSFLRQAISQRENFMKGSCCVRGRQGAIHSPGHWTRDLLRLPPIAAELPEEFEQSFLIGKPWFFGEHEFLTEQCILS